MPESELDTLIARLLADSACNLEPSTQIVTLPESLPGDVRQFFRSWAGGSLYYDPECATPQFGCMLSYSAEQPVSQLLPCDSTEFDSFYTIAEFDTGEYEHAVVSADPDTFGQIYHLRYCLGDPPLTIDDAAFLAPTFTRWLAMHIEAWAVFQEDWREGMQHFTNLIEQERRSRPPRVP